jgi:hypothetical protein
VINPCCKTIPGQFRLSQLIDELADSANDSAELDLKSFLIEKLRSRTLPRCKCKKLKGPNEPSSLREQGHSIFPASQEEAALPHFQAGGLLRVKQGQKG